MLLATFVNVVATSNVTDYTAITVVVASSSTSLQHQRTEEPGIGPIGSTGVSLSFGVVIFCFALAILVTDRLQLGRDVFTYHKASNGRVEGVTLLLVTLYALLGVAYVTQVRGLAYQALNVYFSVWLVLVSCIYTLNAWSTTHDILSLSELTGVSATLKSWYIVAVSSMVVTGTCINMLAVLASTDNSSNNNSSSGGSDTNNSDVYHLDNVRAAVFGMSFGFVSTVLSVWFILTHYNFVGCCAVTEGGWVELFGILIVILLWVVGTAVLTQYGGIASTIIGTPQRQYMQEQQPRQEQTFFNASGNIATAFDESTMFDTDCVVTFQNSSYACADVFQPPTTTTTTPTPQRNFVQPIPGSNLYIAVWICFLGSLNLVLRWKAQQALQFAQAQQMRATAQTEGSRKDAEEGRDDDDDDFDDLDDFDDANDY